MELRCYGVHCWRRRYPFLVVILQARCRRRHIKQFGHGSLERREMNGWVMIVYLFVAIGDVLHDNFTFKKFPATLTWLCPSLNLNSLPEL